MFRIIIIENMSLDMSLDEIISKQRSSRNTKKFHDRNATVVKKGDDKFHRTSRKAVFKKDTNSGIDGKWKHDLFEQMETPVANKKHLKNPVAIKGGRTENARILVSTLPCDVSDKEVEDMFERFSSTGVQVHYSAEGESLGTAEVFFGNVANARAALKAYEGVCMDGVPLDFTLLTDVVAEKKNISSRLTLPGGKFKKLPNSKRQFASPVQNTHRGMGGGRKKGNQRSSKKHLDNVFLDRLGDDAQFQSEQKKKREYMDLDKDLENYMSKGVKKSLKHMSFSIEDLKSKGIKCKGRGGHKELRSVSLDYMLYEGEGEDDSLPEERAKFSTQRWKNDKYDYLSSSNYSSDWPEKYVKPASSKKCASSPRKTDLGQLESQTDFKTNVSPMVSRFDNEGDQMIGSDKLPCKIYKEFSSASMTDDVPQVSVCENAINMPKQSKNLLTNPPKSARRAKIEIDFDEDLKLYMDHLCID